MLEDPVGRSAVVFVFGLSTFGYVAKGLPEVVGDVWQLTTVQTSSIYTGRRRDGLAGHRAIGRGPTQRDGLQQQLDDLGGDRAG